MSRDLKSDNIRFSPNVENFESEVRLDLDFPNAHDPFSKLCVLVQHRMQPRLFQALPAAFGKHLVTALGAKQRHWIFASYTASRTSARSSAFNFL